MKLLITGGGTGGHVNPGLAIAKYVQSRRADVEVRFAGTSTGIESRLVPREGYRLYTVDVRGLRRSLKPSAIAYNIATLQKSLTATGKAKKILREFRPDVVIGCGGYASFPMVHAAQQLHIPTVLLEVNAFPGVVTKSCAKKADRVLICFENTRQLLENRPNIHLTGAPVKACDLRAGAALMIAGLAASGVTTIEDIYHIERGYADMEGKLRALGACIEKKTVVQDAVQHDEHEERETHVPIARQDAV